MHKGVLWSFGDSFTAGTGKDISRGAPYPMMHVMGKPRAYPEYIARNLNLRSVNLAEGGHGNNDIVNTIIKASPNFDRRTDFILIGLTTPFRNRTKCTPLQALKLLIQDLGMIEVVLKDYRHMITSAFCPLVPYYFKSEDIDFEINHYIEWGKPNNTLIDICGGSWLDSNKVNPVMKKGGIETLATGINVFPDDYNGNLESCGHPSSAGHKLIAQTLSPYIDKVAAPKDISYI